MLRVADRGQIRPVRFPRLTESQFKWMRPELRMMIEELAEPGPAGSGNLGDQHKRAVDRAGTARCAPAIAAESVAGVPRLGNAPTEHALEHHVTLSRSACIRTARAPLWEDGGCAH